jgi:N-methyl-L-tryptophan oxidase
MGASAAFACMNARIPFQLIESNHSVITSSWGESRILRLSYGDPLYVRMMQRSYVLWNALERHSNKQLLLKKPVLTIFNETDPGSMQNMRDQMNAFAATRTEFELRRDTSDLNVKLAENEIALLQEDGACVLATEALTSLRDLAESVSSDDRIIRINTSDKTLVGESGTKYKYDKLILCAGAWTNKLLRESGLSELPYVASLEQFCYYDFQRGQEDKNIPIVLEAKKYTNGRLGGVYLMPHIEDGVPGIKMGLHCNGQIMQNDDFLIPKLDSLNLSRLPNERLNSNQFLTGIETHLDPYMETETRDFVRSRLPSISADHVSSYGRCIYQACALKDGRFLIGVHPQNPDIVIACGFTGEGFKFAPVIGEFLAHLALGDGSISNKALFDDMTVAFKLDRQ